MTTEISLDPVLAARYRALSALAALEDAARELYGRLEKDPRARVSEKSANSLREEAARVTASLAVMEALRNAADLSAPRGRRLPGSADVNARTPRHCHICGASGAVEALAKVEEGRWHCLDGDGCDQRAAGPAANGGRAVPQAVAEAREVRAWRDGYEYAAGQYGPEARCTGGCDQASGIHAPGRARRGKVGDMGEMAEMAVSVADLDTMIASLEARRAGYVLAAEKAGGNSTRARVDRARLESTGTGLALALGELRNMRAFAAARNVPDIPVIMKVSEVVHEHGPYVRHTHLRGSESHEGVPQK